MAKLYLGNQHYDAIEAYEKFPAQEQKRLAYQFYFHPDNTYAKKFLNRVFEVEGSEINKWDEWVEFLKGEPASYSGLAATKNIPLNVQKAIMNIFNGFLFDTVRELKPLLVGYDEPMRIPPAEEVTSAMEQLDKDISSLESFMGSKGQFVNVRKAVQRRVGEIRTGRNPLTEISDVFDTGADKGDVKKTSAEIETTFIYLKNNLRKSLAISKSLHQNLHVLGITIKSDPVLRGIYSPSLVNRGKKIDPYGPLAKPNYDPKNIPKIRKRIKAHAEEIRKLLLKKTKVQLQIKKAFEYLQPILTKELQEMVEEGQIDKTNVSAADKFIKKSVDFMKNEAPEYIPFVSFRRNFDWSKDLLDPENVAEVLGLGIDVGAIWLAWNAFLLASGGIVVKLLTSIIIYLLGDIVGGALLTRFIGWSVQVLDEFVDSISGTGAWQPNRPVRHEDEPVSTLTTR